MLLLLHLMLVKLLLLLLLLLLLQILGVEAGVRMHRHGGSTGFAAIVHGESILQVLGQT